MLKTTRIGLLAVLVSAVMLVSAGAAEKWSPVSGHAYKQISGEGYSNCIFAPKEIGKNKEAAAGIKQAFTKPEPVYARCYFPAPVGKVKGGNFWFELWIDRKHRGKVTFAKPPDAGWRQTQVWVTEDDFKKQMRSLGSGKHEGIIWVMKRVFKGKKAVAGQDASGKIKAEMKDIWIPVRLSKGKFTYSVP